MAKALETHLRLTDKSRLKLIICVGTPVSRFRVRVTTPASALYLIRNFTESVPFMAMRVVVSKLPPSRTS